MAELDPSILLQGRPLQVPNPLALATQGLSLADLANRNQLMQYQVATQQQYQQAVQQLGNAQAQGQDPNSIIPQIAQQYPLAYAKILADQKALELTKAQITEATGKGQEASANAFKASMGAAANLASGMQQQPGGYTPMQAQQLAAQVTHAYKVGGYDPSDLNIPTDPAGFDQFVKATAATGIPAKDAADIKNTLEGLLPKEKAEAQKTQVEAGYAAPLAEATIAAKRAEAANVYAPKVEVDAFGRPLVLQRFGQGGPSISTAPTASQPQMTPNMTMGADFTPGQQAAAQADFARTGGLPLPGGVTPQTQGAPLAAPGVAQAQAIANYQSAPASRATPFGAALMDQVMQMNPKYDQTLWDAKQKTAEKFATGEEGQLLRSQNVAISHMAQLSQLGTALQNGNVQLFNQIANQIAIQSGSPVPTNFNAAAQIVGKEVAKAVVAGGGGEGERDAILQTFGNAQSPAQISGAINQYQGLLGGQMNGLRQQYNANIDPLNTGKTDFSKFVAPETASVLQRVQAAAPASSARPQIGEVRRGYLYKGGDPAQQSSWEKVDR